MFNIESYFNMPVLGHNCQLYNHFKILFIYVCLFQCKCVSESLTLNHLTQRRLNLDQR